jgi:hypothetical protein
MKVQTYDLDWKKSAIPFITQAFSSFKPRSEFLKKNAEVRQQNLASNEQANILEVKTHLSPYTNKLVDFDKVFELCPNYTEIRKTMNNIIAYVSEVAICSQVSFVTFATDITNAEMGIRHLHPKMNGDRCNVMTFGIPLYLGKNAPSFDIHISENQWPARYYVDYSRIRDLNLSYMKLILPMDGSIFHMQFDGSRHPHVITYSDSIFMWFVFDGVEFKDQRDLGSSLSLQLL